MTTASTVLVESASPTPARPIPMPPPPRASGDELGPMGRRALIGSVVAAHLVGGWALLQLDVVREAVAQVVPVLMVDMVAPPEPAPPPQVAPKRLAAAPAPVIAAAPAPTAAPATFVAPPPEPVPPQPVIAAAAPPAPPAAVPAPPAPPSILQVPPSSVRYVKQPDLNFPALARRAGESGTVVLRIIVDVNGRLREATVERSSGFDRIDQAALRDIRSARFAPRMEDGRPVEISTLAALQYEL